MHKKHKQAALKSYLSVLESSHESLLYHICNRKASYTCCCCDVMECSQIFKVLREQSIGIFIVILRKERECQFCLERLFVGHGEDSKEPPDSKESKKSLSGAEFYI